MPDYWLFVTDEVNWEICLENRTWGTHDGHAGKFKQIQLEDIIIVYLTGFKLAGTCKVNRTYFYDEDQLWPNKPYHHRIGFEPDNLLEEPKNIRNFYYENFSESPAGYFRTSIRKLPVEEAKLLLKSIDDAVRTVNLSINTFDLTPEDFKACRQSTSENYILPVRRKFNKLLKPQLITALGKKFNDFQKTDPHTSPYVSKSTSFKGGFHYRGHVWLGMAHEKYDDPRNGVQFQFGIKKDAVFSYGIWIEGGSYAKNTRKTVIEILLRDRRKFIEYSKKLSDNFKICLSDSEVEIRPSELIEDDVGVIIDGLAAEDYFNIRYEFSPQEAIDLKTSIVKQIAEKFTELLPLYDFLAELEVKEHRNYFILRTGGGEYEDVPQSIYHFKEGIPGYRQLLEAENNGEFVYYEPSKGGFWARGIIDLIRQEEREEVLHYFMNVDQFMEIGPITFDSVEGQLSFKEVGQAGINKISQHDFEIITSFQPVIERFELDTILEKLSASHLISGKNIILYGPPGTGKTRLAKSLAEKFCGERYTIVTANAEWSTFNVVGGDHITGQEGEGLRTTFRKGFLAQAASEGLTQPYWIIIDELNRANLDLAFGEAFTLLDIEHRNKMPLVRKRYDDVSIKEDLFLPSSFRLISTLNSYDRSALFSLGYAFRRRFAFVEVPSPYHQTQDENELEIEDIEWQSLSDEDEVYSEVYDEVNRWINLQQDPPIIDPNKRIINLDSFKSKLSENHELLMTEPLNVFRLFHFLSRWITQQDIVSIGYAQTVDAIKFIHAFLCLEDAIPSNVYRAVDYAFLSYYMPHLEYFLPRVRRERIGSASSEEESLEKLDELKKILLVNGLKMSGNSLEKIINRLVKFGDVSVI